MRRLDAVSAPGCADSSRDGSVEGDVLGVVAVDGFAVLRHLDLALLVEGEDQLALADLGPADGGAEVVALELGPRLGGVEAVGRARPPGVLEGRRGLVDLVALGTVADDDRRRLVVLGSVGRHALALDPSLRPLDGEPGTGQ